MDRKIERRKEKTIKSWIIPIPEEQRNKKNKTSIKFWKKNPKFNNPELAQQIKNIEEKNKNVMC